MTLTSFTLSHFHGCIEIPFANHESVALCISPPRMVFIYKYLYALADAYKRPYLLKQLQLFKTYYITINKDHS